MRLIIDIGENDYHRIASGFGQEEDALLLEKIFKNGTLIPDNATVCDIEQIRTEIKSLKIHGTDDVSITNNFAIDKVLQIIDKYMKGGKE